MLKIKDEVDLKELEKFEYKKLGLPMFNDYFKNLDNNIFIAINERNNIVSSSKISAYKGNPKNWLDLGGNVYEEIETKDEYIQDLITAGLVEKV